MGGWGSWTFKPRGNATFILPSGDANSGGGPANSAGNFFFSSSTDVKSLREPLERSAEYANCLTNRSAAGIRRDPTRQTELRHQLVYDLSSSLNCFTDWPPRLMCRSWDPPMFVRRRQGRELLHRHCRRNGRLNHSDFSFYELSERVGVLLLRLQFTDLN